MKIVFFSIKGGVGKTSISLSMALTYKYNFVTNDIVTSLEGIHSIKASKIASSLKKIPRPILGSSKNQIFDIGAMSGQIDPKAAHAISLADAVVIPTLCDTRSVEATIQSIKFVKEACHNIFVIVNKVKDEKEYESIVEHLSPYVDEEFIYQMRETTLFKRIAEHGENFFTKIFKKEGINRLHLTIDRHTDIFDSILDYTQSIVNVKGK